MHGFIIESKTSGISSSSTLWQDLEDPYKTCNKANLTPRSPGTKPGRWKLWGPTQKSVESCGTRSYVKLGDKWRQGPTCRRGKDLEDARTDVGQRRQANGPGWAQADRPSPFQGPVASPFDLAAIRALHSPGVKSHTSIHLSSATEE
jgi:hypothetical protein